MALTVASFNTPVGTLVPALNNTTYNSSFNNSATFACGSGETCAAGEYRQYVRGSFRVNGSTLTHILCGAVVMSPVNWLEDGCPSGICTAYGHRSCPTSPMDNYSPAQATGCVFAMHDAPGFTNVQVGTTYTIDLAFRATMINTVLGGQVLQQRDWAVQGTHTVAAAAVGAMTVTRMVALTEADAPRFAVSRVNDHSKAGEVHIIMQRPRGQAALDPASLHVVVRDARGAPIAQSAPPQVHEIVGRNRNTANIVATLAPGNAQPAQVELGKQGGTVTLAVTRG